MAVRWLWFWRSTICLALVLTAVINVCPRIALAQGDTFAIEPPIAADTAVLELDVPAGAEVSINGVPQGDRRRVEFRSFPPRVSGRYEVIAQLRGGSQLKRTVVLKGGWRVNLRLQEQAERPELVVQKGHSSFMLCARFSPNGKYALTAGSDHTAILWDVESGRLIRSYRGHTDFINSVAFSPDGRHILTGSRDKTAIVWDTETGEILRTIRGHADGLMDACFSPDGQTILTGSVDKTAAAWNVNSGQLIQRFRAHSQKIFSVAFSPDGRRVLTGSGDGTAIVWETLTGQARKLLRGNGGGIYSVAFHPDGLRALTGSIDATVVEWDTATGQILRTLRGPHDAVKSVSFSSDGRYILGGSMNSQTGVWIAETGELIHVFSHRSFALFSAAFSPNDKYVITTSFEDGACIWDVQTGKELRFLGKPTKRSPKALTSRDGRSMLIGFGNLNLLWDSKGGSPLQVLKQETVNLAALSSEGDRAIAIINQSWGTHVRDTTTGEFKNMGGVRGKTVVWDTKTGQMFRELHGHVGLVESVAISFDGRRALTGSIDKTAILWDIQTGQALQTLRGHVASVSSVDISTDGKRALTGSDDQTAVLWDTETARPLRALRGHREKIGSVALSPNGRFALTGSDDQAAILWDVETGRPTRVLNGKSGPVTAVAFSPQGDFAITGFDDGKAIVWKVETGQAIQSLRGNFNSITSISCRSDGRSVLTGSFDGTCHLWDVATGEELASLISPQSGELLVVTPEGLFDGSEGGRQAVTFRVGGRLNVVPVDRFFQDFYHPGLLAELWRGKRPMPETDFARTKPPSLRIVSPRGGTSETVNVLAEVQAVDQGGGVSGLALFHNGARILSHNSSVDGKTTRRRFSVTLVEGTNRLKATAASGDGSWESEPVEIALDYEKPLPKSELYVVAVGVNRYADAALNLQYAARDAQAFADLFRKRGGRLYGQVHVTELIDDQASRAGITTALREAAGRTRPQDTLVLFLAGHGVMVGQRYYFLPHEPHRQADRLDDDVSHQGLAVDVLTDAVGTAKALKRALILDTCASGGALGVVLKSRSGMSFRKAIERQARTQGIFTIAAASATAQAQESEKLGHGVLSYALLAGMKAVDGGPLEGQSAAAGAEGVVDVLEWFNYAAGRVPRLMESLYGSAQDVQLGAQGASFPVLPVEDH
jgi:WD40 repeat protein